MEANQQQERYTKAEYIKMIKKHFFINNIPYKKSYNRAKKQVLQEIIIDNNIDINKYETDATFLSDYSVFMMAVEIKKSLIKYESLDEEEYIYYLE